MPHVPEALFQSPKRNTWYVELNRVQHALGKHPARPAWKAEKGKGGWEPPPKSARRSTSTMAELGDNSDKSDAARPYTRRRATSLSPASSTTSSSWLTQSRVEEGSKERRTPGGTPRLSGVVSRTPAVAGVSPAAVPSLTIDQLRPSHLYGWVDSQPRWKTGRRGAIIAVQRALNWASKAGKLGLLGGKSPLAGMEKPPPGRREAGHPAGRVPGCSMLFTGTGNSATCSPPRGRPGRVPTSCSPSRRPSSTRRARVGCSRSGGARASACSASST